jgi:hypothetical protein
MNPRKSRELNHEERRESLGKFGSCEWELGIDLQGIMTEDGK